MKTYIKVIGIGNSGISAVHRMKKSGITNVEFWCMDTDLSTLQNSNCANKLQLGVQSVGGLGTNGNPQIGMLAAQEVRQDIVQAIAGADIVFVVSGMGGGTGTGASPIVANIAKISGALTIGVVSEPFSFEGRNRRVAAQQGVNGLRIYTDSIYAIQNDKLLPYVDRKCRLIDSFILVDEVICRFTQTIVDIVNVKCEEAITMLKSAGIIDMGLGIAFGDRRGENATTIAINSSLLRKPICNVSNMIAVISGGKDLTSHETEFVYDYIKDFFCDGTNIIVGVTNDDDLTGEIQITLIVSHNSNLLNN